MATAPLNRILGQLRVSLADAPDADLLKAFLGNRDSAAFAAIVRRHSPTVLNACRQMLRHEPDVEDAFQATFLVLLKNAHAIRDRQSLGSWLFGVAHRVAVNARGRRAKLETRERTNEQLPHPAGESPDLSWREASVLLHDELNRLPDKLRLPLLLCYLEGKSRDEAAAELGWSVGMVKGSLERGRVKLRDRLQRRGIALSAGLLAAVAVTPGSAAPPAWVDSVVSIAGSGPVRPAVSALARGVSPVLASTRRWGSALAAAVLIGVGTLIAAHTSTDAPPRKDLPAAAAKDAPKPPAGEKLVVTGKVTDAEGKPVSGAKLYVPYAKKEPPTSEDDIGAKVVGETAVDGTFRVEVEKTEYTRYLIVGAGGHAIGWANLEDATGTHETAVTLAGDQPVEGRVIDTEGRPVPGAAVKVVAVLVPAGKLDQFLAGWKNEWQDALRLMNDRMYMPLESLHGAGKTDKDGRFTLKGLGIERVGQVEIAAPGYGKASVYVVTRPGLDAGPINKAAHDKIPPELRIPGQPPLLSGPKVEAILEGSKVIEGTVTDAQTGKPMPRVIVTSGSGYNSQVMATSDKDGKYRLTGLVKNREYLVHTLTRDEKTTPYLMWSARIKDTEGLTPIRHDIQMTKGVVVTGRLIDRQTGKAVGGSVRFAPLPDNKYFGSKAAYNGYSEGDRLSHMVENGKFRVVTIPGTSVLMAQAYDDKGEKLGGKPVNPYLRAVPDPDHPQYFAKDGEGSYRVTAAGNSLEFLSILHAVKVVDLKADAGEVTVELYLERGKTASLKVQGPDGQPLAGATVAGLTASWPATYTLPTDTATVYALDPARPRTLYLLHPEKKLAAWVRVRGDEKGPVTVKLAPVGVVTGKLVDPDGRPVAGVMVNLQFPSGPGGDLYRETLAGRPMAVTDKDGAFRVEPIVPEVKFGLSLTKGQMYFQGEPRIGQREVKPGQTLELGALTVRGRRFGE
ncbi:MAG TPA: sigma-70 family RNA polymerase sigma factor [Gemmataceae bacterium]|nr:sigma-70 family RNA polymerase sigma factor [Gemmataceae bacterium]